MDVLISDLLFPLRTIQSNRTFKWIIRFNGIVPSQTYQSNRKQVTVYFFFFIKLYTCYKCICFHRVLHRFNDSIYACTSDTFRFLSHEPCMDSCFLREIHELHTTKSRAKYKIIVISQRSYLLVSLRFIPVQSSTQSRFDDVAKNLFNYTFNS